MFPVQEEADRMVFVGNLEAHVREEILYELFLQFFIGWAINQSDYMQRQRRKAEVFWICLL